MKRRKFIIISSAGAAYAGLASCSFLQQDIDDTVLAEPLFLQFIWDQGTMTDIGASYAKIFPEDDFKKQLNKLITENRSDQEAVKNRLKEIIFKDFSEEETVMLDGWVLSRTEARQCAIFYHLHQGDNYVN